MLTINAPEFARNYGFWNEPEQQALLNSRVAIAGAGGDGYQLGIKLAMMGVPSFSVADPEEFEAENSNRVPGATTLTYGLKKALVFASQVHNINPDARVDVFTDGVNSDNVGDFMAGADLVLDESELTHLEIGTTVAREARRLGIPDMLVMNVGFSALVTSFHPNARRKFERFRPHSRQTFEGFMGIPDDMPLDEVTEQTVDFARCLPYVPSYGDIRTLVAVQNGAPLPSIAQGVDIASAIGASQAFLHLTRQAGNHRPEPIWAPRVGFLDAYNLDSGIVSHPMASHYRHLLHMVGRNLVHANPQGSYTDADRQNRTDQHQQ